MGTRWVTKVDDPDFSLKDEELARMRGSEDFDPEKGVLVSMSLPSDLRSIRMTILGMLVMIASVLIIPAVLLVVWFWDDPESSRWMIVLFSGAFFGTGVLIILIFLSFMNSIHSMTFYSKGISVKAMLKPPRFVPWNQFEGYRMAEWGFGKDKLELVFQDRQEMTINPTHHDFDKITELVKIKLEEVPKAPEVDT
jgi:hypothetical protein